MKAKLTPRQAEVLDFLTRYVSETGYPPTIREIARHLGVKGISAIKKHLDALERKGYLTRGNGARAIEMADLPRSVSVPVLGRVAAGKPILAEENVLGILSLDPSMVRGGQVFLLKVKGDSMIGAGILDGDLVLVKVQPRVESGEIAVVLVDDEATVKRIQYYGPQVVLKPENPDHLPITLTPKDNFSVIGKVTGVVRIPVF